MEQAGKYNNIYSLPLFFSSYSLEGNILIHIFEQSVANTTIYLLLEQTHDSKYFCLLPFSSLYSLVR
jgi:hypothetical protein